MNAFMLGFLVTAVFLLTYGVIKLATKVAEVVEKLQGMQVRMTKIEGETRTLLLRVEELIQIIDDQDDVPDEIATAIEALDSQMQIVDGLVKDVAPPEEPPVEG